MDDMFFFTCKYGAFVIADVTVCIVCLRNRRKGSHPHPVFGDLLVYVLAIQVGGGGGAAGPAGQWHHN